MKWLLGIHCTPPEREVVPPMRGIFSILFGASIVLLTERMERAGAGLATAEIYFRRTLWLLLFGIIQLQNKIRRTSTIAR